MSTPSQSSSEAGAKQEKPSSTVAAGQHDIDGLLREYGFLDPDLEYETYHVEIDVGMWNILIQDPLTMMSEADYLTLRRAFGLCVYSGHLLEVDD